MKKLVLAAALTLGFTAVPALSVMPATAGVTIHIGGGGYHHHHHGHWVRVCRWWHHHRHCHSEWRRW